MRIEVWADIICPWCAIGHHRLRQALQAEGLQAEVVHRAFELDPDRAASEPSPDMLRQRYGPQADAMMAQVRQVAAADGLAIRPEQAIAANTFDAHRLVLWAQGRGPRDGEALRQALFDAHFVRSLDLADPAVLLDLAAEAGLPRDEAAAALAGDAMAEQVRADQAVARAIGVRGVPFFVVDRKWAASGAQPAETLRGLLRRAAGG